MIKHLVIAATLVASSASAYTQDQYDAFKNFVDSFPKPEVVVEEPTPAPALPTGPASYQIRNRSAANIVVVACIDGTAVNKRTVHAGQTVVIDETDYCERELHIELTGINSPAYKQPLLNDDIHRNVDVHGSSFGQWVTSENVRYGATTTHHIPGNLGNRILQVWSY